MSKKQISTDQAPSAIGPYSQAIQAGDMLFVSGQIPLEPKTGDLIGGDIGAQTHKVLKNLKGVIEAAGTTMDHVVKTTIFLKDLSDFNAVNEVYGEYFRAPYPARACVEVARLPKDVDVEIDAIANVIS
jgi:2-iminobutanoate/2-iminopropanoate deaminase